jgi:hypothetical protein
MGTDRGPLVIREAQFGNHCFIIEPSLSPLPFTYRMTVFHILRSDTVLGVTDAARSSVYQPQKFATCDAEEPKPRILSASRARRK